LDKHRTYQVELATKETSMQVILINKGKIKYLEFVAEMWSWRKNS
jgi:hypothetical protein